MTAATLFVGGRILTGRRYAEALLIEEGRVVAVGPEAATRSAAATGTERVDLVGGLVVPGLADAHLHLGELARARAGFDAGAASSVDELARRLSRWAETHPRVPIVGNGLDPGSLAERRWPTAGELDAAVSDRPLVLFDASGHAAALNTAALERAFDSGRPVSDGGRPSWVVVEDGLDALRPIVAEGLPLTLDAMTSTLAELARVGLTSVGTMNTGAEELSVLAYLDDADRLPIRVHAYPPSARALHGRPRDDGRRPRRLAVAGFKAFLDGAFGPRTASLTEAYADEPSTTGVDRGDDAALAAAIETARGLGLSPALHAIGDRAVARAVRLLSGPPANHRPSRIEHASLTPPALLDALRRLGAHLVVQPGFLLTDLWLRNRLGPVRARWAYAFRTLADQGVPLAGSSDAPYDLPDPWRGMRAAVRRQDELGRSANPSPLQALSEREALALYTTGARRALGEELGGMLEPGAPADLVVLSVPRLGDAIRRGEAVVRQTWVAGKVVARSPSGPEERR